MKPSKLLFPHRFKPYAAVVFIISCLLGILYISVPQLFPEDMFLCKVFAIYNEVLFGEDQWFQIIENNIIDELISISIIVSGLILGFSKQAFEDEYIKTIRLESLMWATYANYIVFALILFFVYGNLSLILISSFTLLIVFNIRFYFKLHQLKTA